MEKSRILNSSVAKFLDWALSFCAVAVGLYIESKLLVSVGIIGFICAWLQPATKMANYLKSLKKTSI